MCFVLIGLTYEGDEPILIAKKDTQSECEVIRDTILGARKDHSELVNAIYAQYKEEVASVVGITKTEDYKLYMEEQRRKRKVAIDALPVPPYSDVDFFAIL